MGKANIEKESDLKKSKEKTFVEKLFYKKLTRREFIKCTLIALGAIATATYGYKHLFGKSSGSLPNIFPASAPDTLWKWSKEAMFYKKIGDNVQCQLCPHSCSLALEDRGICRGRVNKDGKLYSLVYGNPCAVHTDPIEKKPFFHFLPTSLAFSIATAGCNLRCLNCQNWQISQFQPEETTNYDLMPEDVVVNAKNDNCQSIAYTYSEPIIYFEYMYDTAKIAKQHGIKNVMVTAGYINEKPLRDLCKVIDGITLDIKGFNDSTYNKLNGATLKPILANLKTIKDEKVWLEISNLVVTSWTDDLDKIKEFCQWLYKNGFEDYPLHFLRFQPQYKLTHLPPTPASTLNNARKIAIEEGLKFVYIGNIPGTDAENTYCPKCGKTIIERKGFTVIENNIKNGTCGFCGEKIAGVWEA